LIAEEEGVKLYLMVLWHMHQPYYVNPATGRALLPWVRLHATKDYYGMVALLREFPNIKQTFNIVPSLAEQLLGYCNGSITDEHLIYSRKPSESLNENEKRWIIKNFFSAHLENMILPFPRYAELHRKMKRREIFTAQDIRDLQVWFRLSWFDADEKREDPLLANLIEKGRDFTEDDKRLLDEYEMAFLKKIIPEYKAAQERGQIEISSSPYYHPILPLLIDSALGARSNPGTRLPRAHFRHPEDAREQVSAAIAYHQHIFDRPPRGMWPSEGSVSEEVCRMLSDCGLSWTASDEEVLAMSQGGRWFDRDGSGCPEEPERLYTPYSFGGITIFFRDHQLSDLIGFVYSRSDADEAAIDFVERLRQIAINSRNHNHRPVVSMILDGENAWEFYKQDGRPFLRSLYSLLSQSSWIETVTPGQIIDNPEITPRPLERLHPGSWINHNFNIWIGHPEDNLAWEQLAEARRTLVDWQRENNSPDKEEIIKRAWNNIYIAEGSDWFWWYGEDHSSTHDKEFDALFRLHLKSVYQSIDEMPPLRLDQPIKGFARTMADESWSAKSAIEPKIDGRHTSYFEWAMAGGYQHRSSGTAMHRTERFIKRVLHGRGNDGRLQLLIEWERNFLDQALKRGEVGLEITIENTGKFYYIPIGPGKRVESEECLAATDKVSEISLGGELTEIEECQLSLSVHVQKTIVEKVPEFGTISVKKIER